MTASSTNLSASAPVLGRGVVAKLVGVSALVATILAALLYESAVSPLGYGGAALDLSSAVTPHWQFIADALRAGRLPLWNPHIFTGQPELAVAQWGVLYPVQAALLLLLPVRDAILVSVWLHLSLTFLAGALLCAAWLRASDLEVGVAACVLGGLALLCSGAVMGHLYAGHLVLTQATPWYVLGIAAGLWHLTGVRRDPGGDVEGDVRSDVGGAPPTSPAAVGLAAPWAGPLMAASFALGVLAGGVQIAPFVALAALALWGAASVGRAPSLRRVLSLGAWLVFALLLTAAQLWPTLELTAHSGRGLLGELPIHPRYLLRGKDLLGVVAPTATTDWERAAFLSAPVLALAMARLRGPRRQRAVVLWLVAAVCWWMGTAMAVPLIARIPGLRMLRVPARSVWVVTLVLPPLAAAALALPRASRARVTRLAAWLCGGLALLVGMAGRGVVAATIQLLAAGGLAWLAWRPGPRARSLAITLAGFALLLLGAALTFRPMSEVRALPPELLPPFQRAAPSERVLTAVGGIWNAGMAHGYLNLGGYEPLMTARTLRLARAISANPSAKRLYAIVPDRPPPPHPLWARLGVRWVLAEDTPALAAWGRRAASAGSFALFQGLHTTPRAYLVERPHRVAGPEAALAWLTKAKGRRAAAIEGGIEGGPAERGAGAGADEPAAGEARAIGPPVRFERADPERLVLHVAPTRPAWLVVNDLLYPGWRAQVDGRPTTLRHANGVGRALRVPAGSHRVEMVFSPRSVRWGLWISGCAWLCLLVVLAWLLALGGSAGTALAPVESAHAVGQVRDEADALLAAEDLLL